jgi:hypothetical protein
MPEVVRDRDLIIFKKGDAYTVAVSGATAQQGWVGGQGGQWFDSSCDRFTVELTDGAANGFFLRGSDEDGDKYTSMTRNQPYYRYCVFGFGGWLVATRSFERYTYASRLSGPLVENTYQEQDEVVFSLRGLFTTEDEWTLSGDPRAPNTNVVGVVVKSPSDLTGNYITLQVRI